MAYIGTDINYGNLAKQTGTGDGADTTPIAALTYTVPSSESILVFLDGVCQVPATDFTASGTTLTFTTAPANGVAILVMFLGRSLDIGTPADNTVSNAKMTANSVDSDQYVDGSIDTIHIANNQVDETKLKDALIGDFSDVTITAADTILYGDATDSGNTKKDTVQGILDLVPAGGDYKLLYTHNASAATWTFNSSTGVDVATYGAYVFILATVFNVSNDARLQIEVSDDDGSSWKSTGYQYWNRSIDQDGTLETHLSTSDSEIQVTTGGFRSATAQGGLTGTIFAPHNGSESGKSFMTWMVSCQMNSGYDYMTTWGGGEYNAGVFDAGGADAWRFSVSSGNISGTMKMYGYK